MMKSLRLLSLCLLPTMLASCLSVQLGTEDRPSRLQMDGLASGYATIEAFPKYDGNILKAGLFQESARDGEWASIDIWPLGGIGVGFIGARVRVLFFEVGLGVLAYTPTRPPRQAEKVEVQHFDKPASTSTSAEPSTPAKSEKKE